MRLAGDEERVDGAGHGAQFAEERSLAHAALAEEDCFDAWEGVEEAGDEEGDGGDLGSATARDAEDFGVIFGGGLHGGGDRIGVVEGGGVDVEAVYDGDWVRLNVMLVHEEVAPAAEATAGEVEIEALCFGIMQEFRGKIDDFDGILEFVGYFPFEGGFAFAAFPFGVL